MMASPKVRDATGISLWPNPVPLECGVIRNHDRPPGTNEKGTGTSKFTIHNLKKIYGYLKTKGKGAFPNLRYSIWLHIVKNKFGFSDDLAWLYFEMFDVVSDLESTERLTVLEAANDCSTQEELDALRKKLNVDTSRFLLFLYIQSTPRLSLKSSAATGDEWPSPESEKKQKFPENAHLSFVKIHIPEMLELLADIDTVTQGKYLTIEAVNALDFLICASNDNERTTLTSLACQHAVSSGYSKIHSNFSLHHFEHWLKSHLSLNPFGPQAVFSKRREMRVPCYSSEGVGRLLANRLTAPKGCKTAVLSRLTNQTLAVCEDGLAGCDVHIRNCRRSSIYLLSPMRTVQVEKCSHCLLVLGAVEAVVAVSNCDSVTIVTACRKVHISSSSLCVFHLLTMTRPLIFPSCFHLSLAPYNTHYPQLEAHLLACGLNANVRNYWNHPMPIGNGEDESIVCELMCPENFRPLSIPFQMSGATLENPCPLPQSFQRVLAARRQSIKKWYETINKAELTEPQTTQLQKTVRDSFQEWLSQNGYDKDIAALSPKEPSQKTPTKPKT